MICAITNDQATKIVTKITVHPTVKRAYNNCILIYIILTIHKDSQVKILNKDSNIFNTMNKLVLLQSQLSKLVFLIKSFVFLVFLDNIHLISIHGYFRYLFIVQLKI